jgi:hypothetical protein
MVSIILYSHLPTNHYVSIAAPYVQGKKTQVYTYRIVDTYTYMIKCTWLYVHTYIGIYVYIHKTPVDHGYIPYYSGPKTDLLLKLFCPSACDRRHRRRRVAVIHLRGVSS